MELFYDGKYFIKDSRGQICCKISNRLIPFNDILYWEYSDTLKQIDRSSDILHLLTDDDMDDMYQRENRYPHKFLSERKTSRHQREKSKYFCMKNNKNTKKPNNKYRETRNTVIIQDNNTKDYTTCTCGREHLHTYMY